MAKKLTSGHEENQDGENGRLIEAPRRTLSVMQGGVTTSRDLIALSKAAMHDFLEGTMTPRGAAVVQAGVSNIVKIKRLEINAAGVGAKPQAVELSSSSEAEPQTMTVGETGDAAVERGNQEAFVTRVARAVCKAVYEQVGDCDREWLRKQIVNAIADAVSRKGTDCDSELLACQVTQTVFEAIARHGRKAA
jgi:hypothetical protein